MALSIVIIILAIIGMVYGIINKNKPWVIISIIVFIMIIAALLYFYNNPY